MNNFMNYQQNLFKTLVKTKYKQVGSAYYLNKFKKIFLKKERNKRIKYKTNYKKKIKCNQMKSLFQKNNNKIMKN